MNLPMYKLGMSSLKIDDNKIVGATFLWADKIVPIQQKCKNKHGYEATLFAFGKGKIKSWNKAQHKLFQSLDFTPKKICESREFITEDKSPLEVHKIFETGSKVDVSGITKGRGFSGPIKRHNFKGLPASHGVSKAHRSHGSTGNRTAPGRVFKGKKMAGHYGNERVTVQSLKVVFAKEMELGNSVGSVIAVMGAVPGCNGSTCYVKHTVKYRSNNS